MGIEMTKWVYKFGDAHENVFERRQGPKNETYLCKKIETP